MLFRSVFSISGNGTDSTYVAKHIAEDAWVHVAGVYDPDATPSPTLKLYVNGVLVDDTSSATVPASIYSSDSGYRRTHNLFGPFFNPAGELNA